MLTSIAGRSVVVTGSSKGIGKGIAKVFSKNGGKVLIGLAISKRRKLAPRSCAAAAGRRRAMPRT